MADLTVDPPTHLIMTCPEHFLDNYPSGTEFTWFFTHCDPKWVTDTINAVGKRGIFPHLSLGPEVFLQPQLLRPLKIMQSCCVHLLNCPWELISFEGGLSLGTVVFGTFASVLFISLAWKLPLWQNLARKNSSFLQSRWGMRGKTKGEKRSKHKLQAREDKSQWQAIMAYKCWKN